MNALASIRSTPDVVPVEEDRQEDLFLRSSATFSPCRTWRYRLDRDVQPAGKVFLFAGVNSSTADEKDEDQTSRKWRGFCLRLGGCRYIAVNPFAYAAKDVRDLAHAEDPVGPNNDIHIRQAIEDADILIPCWGPRTKVPKRLRYRFDEVLALLRASGKPVMALGFTKDGDPRHPMVLAYSDRLMPWPQT